MRDHHALGAAIENPGCGVRVPRAEAGDRRNSEPERRDANRCGSLERGRVVLEIDVDPVKSARRGDHGDVRGAHLIDAHEQRQLARRELPFCLVLTNAVRHRRISLSDAGCEHCLVLRSAQALAHLSHTEWLRPDLQTEARPRRKSRRSYAKPQPRPTNGIFVAITVKNCTLASGVTVAIRTTARATFATSIVGSSMTAPLACGTPRVMRWVISVKAF